MHGRRWSLTLLIGVFAVAASAAPGRAEEGDPAEPALKTQLAELRQALAAARLELRQTTVELEDIKAFLADEDLARTLAEWRAERAKLAAERRALRAERNQLEQARRELHRTTLQQAQREAEQLKAAQQAREQAVQPQWSAQYEMGLIKQDNQTLFVQSTRGSVLVEQNPDIDRHNVMVRGTFLNESQAAWRYTFEVRLAGDEGRILPDAKRRIVGQWRYQTPLLGPGDLHPFEVKVPVTDVHDIEVLQIGKVTADQPRTGRTDPNAPAGRPGPAGQPADPPTGAPPADPQIPAEPMSSSGAEA